MTRSRVSNLPCTPLTAVNWLVLVVVVVATSEARAGSIFPTPLSPASGFLFSVAAGDIDGDGKLDLVAGDADSFYGAVVVLRGAANGTFAPEVRSLIGQRVDDVALADFDRDGDLDVAAALSVSGTIVLLRNDGQGNLTVGPGLQVGVGPNALLVADLNQDAKPDIAASDGEGISVLLGNGDGTFAPRLKLSTGTSLTGVVSADFNGDGRPDLAGCDATGNQVIVFPSLSQGGFGGALSSPTLPAPYAMASGDFDSDGHADVVVSYRNVSPAASAGVALLLGRGDATFQAPRATVLGGGADAFVSGDFDGDGSPDLAGRLVPAGPGPRVAFVLRGRVDGSFGPPATYVAPRQLGDLAAADFDRDGHLDLAMVSTGSGVGILRGVGEGLFGPQPRFRVGPSGAPAVSGDFNGDGAADLATASATFQDCSSGSCTTQPGEMVVSLGRDDGTFSPELSSAGVPDPSGLARGDFDGDGRLDLAVQDRSGDLSTLLNQGGGIMGPAIHLAAGPLPVSLDAADFDRDGLDDLLITHRDHQVCTPIGNGQMCYTAPGDLTIFHAVGGGGFSLQFQLGIVSPSGATGGDFNADGAPDLAVGDQGGGRIYIYLGDGHGAFSLSANLTSASGNLAVADLDGDGHPDLLARAGTSLVAWRGLGDGTFVGPITSPQTNGVAGPLPALSPIGSIVQSAGSRVVALADFDGDGRLDVASGTEIWIGRGDASFGRLGRFLGDGGAVVAADFDRSGLPDVGSGAAGLLLPNQFVPLDTDGDGIIDPLDDCPTIPDPDQNPEVCDQRVVDPAITFASPAGKGAGSVSWRTTHEVDLLGFNVVLLDQRERIQLNAALIPCQACVTGEGARYVFPLPKHKSGRDLFIEMVRRGEVLIFGPAIRM